MKLSFIPLFFVLLLAALLPAVYRSDAQGSFQRKENNVWLNYWEGIDFNSGQPQHRPSSWHGYGLWKGSASICAPDGSLLFYSDGTIIWDRNNDVIQNGWDINNNGNMPPNSFYIDP